MNTPNRLILFAAALLLCLAQQSIAADATAYIQNLAEMGGTIPAGSYEVSQTITLSNSIAGEGTVEIKASKPLPTMFSVQTGGAISNVSLDGSQCRTVIRSSGKVKGFKITHCRITGSLPTTAYLIDLNGDVSDIVIDDTFLSTAQFAIHLRDRIQRATISDCVIKNWWQQAILVRSGPLVGPRDVTIDGVHISEPAAGKGKARQFICAYGDPDNPSPNILRLRILNTTCLGTGQPFDTQSETSTGSGDQIVLHGCIDFEIVNLISNYGGENGAAVTHSSHRGIVANSLFAGNDSHGLHCGSLGRRSTDIRLIANRFVDNALRHDNNVDTMAGLYLQNAAEVYIGDCEFIDSRTPRLTKYGILIGSSNGVTGAGNTITFADPVGAKPIAPFNSKNVEVELLKP